jgi:hypothetical protein
MAPADAMDITNDLELDDNGELRQAERHSKGSDGPAGGMLMGMGC